MLRDRGYVGFVHATEYESLPAILKSGALLTGDKVAKLRETADPALPTPPQRNPYYGRNQSIAPDSTSRTWAI